MKLYILKIYIGLLLLISMAGCASNHPTSQAILAVVDLMKAPSEPVLNPQYQYLKVKVEGRTVYMALGYSRVENGKTIEDWYSADKAVLRLIDGRAASLVGARTEWRNVRQPLAPSWKEVAKAEKALTWQRIRDVMPGYTYGLKETMHIKRINMPDDSAIEYPHAEKLAWFEESIESDALPAAHYAVRMQQVSKPVVVYAEQCFSVDFCLSWQRWPISGE